MKASQLPASLPSISKAKLPEVYENARAALQKCERIDECKSWKDKAAAMASYAKQSQDETLLNTALKIKALATRRCGELMEQFRKPEPGQPRKNGGGSPPILTASGAARDAGLSRDQKRQALRIAAIPRAEFDELVEAERIPTLTELAERGTKSKPVTIDHLAGRSVPDFQAATTAMGWIRRMVEVADEAPVDAVIRGLDEREAAAVLKHAKRALPWLQKLISFLEEK
jgi:hypothetical protein